MPLGLRNSLAILAISLFGATPIEQVRPVRWSIADWIAATPVAAAFELAVLGASEIDVHLIDTAILDDERTKRAITSLNRRE